ncbi:MAG: GNAT family N-acetyltransferase [Candidatus Cloacimonetes bacterium]|jgi:RimJ/RimL family protein N-acetyltransferase|nr:GNAT family N-acetyltransferase [Candidatus Cloacimonadota bacterium]MDD2506895.1 GNAT family N-acetyltransferase [Candidatus Cloacimonadota bacterium]MDD4148271.1 GNAT family N-acetyltransferase [Candidatus Cloacimonadota bacterium]MDD4560400.1 GNAT family N-acetyltransferase [Candidatus Cloacimonadota bacterium]
MLYEINGQKVTLRDLTEADLNDYRKWFKKGLEWTKWDAPWEEMSDTFAQSFIQRLSNRLSKGPQEIKTRLEIEVDGTHIGWVSSYYIESKPGFLAVGISIPEEDFWGRGIGREALQKWIGYMFKNHELDYIYCETWSGNERMVHLAISIGFEIIENDKVLEFNGRQYHKLKFRIGR